MAHYEILSGSEFSLSAARSSACWGKTTHEHMMNTICVICESNICRTKAVVCEDVRKFDRKNDFPKNGSRKATFQLSTCVFIFGLGALTQRTYFFEPPPFLYPSLSFHQTPQLHSTDAVDCDWCSLLAHQQLDCTTISLLVA